MATKKSAAQLHTPTTRVSGDAICGRSRIEALAWWGDDRLITGELYGQVSVWSRDGARLRCAELRQHTPRGVLPLSDDSFLSITDHLISRWRVNPDSLEVVGMERLQSDPLCKPLIAAGVVLTARDGALVAWRSGATSLLERTHELPGLGALIDSSNHWLVGQSSLSPAALSADGSVLTSGVEDKARWLRLDDGQLHTIPDADTILAADPATDRIVAGRRFNDHAIYSIKTGTILHKITNNTIINAARLTADALLLVCDDAHKLTLHDIERDAPRWTRTFTAPISHAALSPDLTRLAIAFEARVLILDVATGDITSSDGPEGEVERITPLAQRVVTSDARRLHSWSLADGAHTSMPSPPCAFVTHDARWAVRYDDPEVRASARLTRADLDAASAQDVAPLAGERIDLALTGDGARLLYLSYVRGKKTQPGTGVLTRLIDLSAAPITDTVIHQTHATARYRLRAGPRSLIAVTSERDLIEVFDAASGALRHALKGVPKGALDLSFSPDEVWLVAACEPKIKCWDMRDGSLRWEAKQDRHTREQLVCVTPDGRHVVSAGRFHDTLSVRDIATGETTCLLRQGAARGFTAMAFGPDDRLYLLGTDAQLHALELPASL